MCVVCVCVVCVCVLCVVCVYVYVCVYVCVHVCVCCTCVCVLCVRACMYMYVCMYFHPPRLSIAIYSRKTTFQFLNMALANNRMNGRGLSNYYYAVSECITDSSRETKH